MKKKFYMELSYIFGLLALALGTAFMEKANFGMSMVVAPAYLVYLKLSQYFSFITFGMAEYIFQAILLIAMMIILRKFRVRFLFSFLTAVIYGIMLDSCIFAVSFINSDFIAVRAVLYVSGLVICSLGVSLLFHTYLSPEVYELFVKEISEKYRFRIDKCKTCYDCISCAFAVILSFIFFGFGHFEGVKLGTIFCALVNGFIIGRFNMMFEKHFDFTAKLKRAVR